MRIIVACVVLLLAAGSAGSSVAAPPSSLKALMDSTGLGYLQDKQGNFIILVVEKTESGADSTVLVLGETALDEAGDKSELKVVYLYSLVVAVPESCKYSHACLTKIASLNDDLVVGKVSVSRGNGILYNSVFWLRTAGAAELTNEITLAHFFRKQLLKELKPFVDEACH